MKLTGLLLAYRGLADNHRKGHSNKGYGNCKDGYESEFHADPLPSDGVTCALDS
jgi:hypothetical protein